MPAHSVNKKLFAAGGALLCVLLLAAGYLCGSLTAREKEPDAAPVKTEFTEEGLPRMLPYAQAIYDAYLKPISVTGVLWQNFFPKDMSPLYGEGELLLPLAAALGDGEDLALCMEGLLSAGYVDEVLTRCFVLQPDSIRRACEETYLPEKDAYSFYGLGGGPAVPVVTGSRLVGRQMTVSYTWYLGNPAAEDFSYQPGDSGELTIDFSTESVWYIKNRIIQNIA
jgi:hypothetical protein